MAAAALGDDLLLQKLRDSRRRFQRRMQQLMEKYSQAFEDAPLVRMSTLTYETPQGLRIWGGRLVKERSKAQVQDAPEETASRGGDPTSAPASSHTPPAPGTCRREAGVGAADPGGSDSSATLYEEEVVAGFWAPAEPPSPLEDDLRRKYLTQVDTLLQDEERPRDGEDKDELVALGPTPASPTGPPQGRGGSPVQRAASSRGGQPSRPYPEDMAVVPRGDSPSLQEVSGDSALGGLGCQADVGSVTLSDLYAGMLHSMSRLLSARPACVISTKTLILQNWGSRRRCRCRHRAARTGCQGGRCARKRPRERPSPPSAPGTGRGALRDCGNLPPQAHPGRAALQLCRPSPLRAHSSWTFLDSSAGRRLGRENRLTRLEWLISPVKTASRPRALPGKGGGHCREIKVKFEKLHREFCRSPGNQPCRALPPASSAVGTPGGDPESPGSPHRLGTCRPGTALGKTRAERSREAPKRLSGRPTGVPAPSPAGPATARSPSCSRLSSALCQGRALRLPGAWASPSRALSLPGPRPSYGRARCKEIKDEFNKLHEEYQAKPPERTKALPRPGAPPHRARVDLQYQQGGASGKSHPSASFPEPRKWALARHSLGGPPCPAPLEVLPSAWLTADAQSGALCPTKRRRLSDPQVCGRRAEAPGSWPAASRAAARPEEEGSSVEPGREETKRSKQDAFRVDKKSDFVLETLH